MLQLRYKITKPCLIYYNHPGRTVGSNPSWTFRPGKGKKPTTIKWRYNADTRWAVVSVGGKGYPHWGYTDRRPGHTCLGASIRQPATVTRNAATGKWTVPFTYYPAGRPVLKRIGEGRSNRASSGWLRVDQRPASTRIARRGVVTDENATLRDRVNFVIGNVPAGTAVDVSSEKRSGGHWTKVRFPAIKGWGYIETRALPAKASSAAVVVPPVAPAPVQACHWKVVWPTAGVYPAPARTTPVKTKHSGDVVGQSCATSHNAAESEVYVQVHLAEGGTGWMRRKALRPV
ncbi:GW dipeptide domain-containing protein [Actinocorallia aurantiaca]|uniref:GW dipeptide domain-containing protein n=1 Tax=Actinocorallia aurantiaca TaxID=46204 RepID=UPI0031E0931C